MFRLVLVTFAVLFLAACSGGGDSDPIRSLTGLTPPTFSDASILPTLNDILQRSDSMTVSDLIVAEVVNGQLRRGPNRWSTSCSRTACRTNSSAGQTFPLSLREYQQAALNPDVRGQYSGVGEKSGVRLAQGQTHAKFARFTTDSTGYEAWLDYSRFEWSRLSVQSGNIGGRDLAGWWVAFGTSVGNDTGTRPTGSATWRGIMLGGSRQAIQGDASLSYDVGRNELDVAFTNVWSLDTREGRPNMQWADLFVEVDGSFRRRQRFSRNIEGRFYGPEHAEVGGTFYHSSVGSGAFGAKRQ